jgi:hypothetical protein
MHWSNVFTIIVALAVGALSFVGTQWATHRQLKEALAARLDAEAAEHRRWLRDQAVGAYLGLMHTEDTVRKRASFPAQGHSYELSAETRNQVAKVISGAMDADVFYRVLAFGSDDLADLAGSYQDQLFFVLGTLVLDDIDRREEEFLKLHDLSDKIELAVRREVHAPTIGTRTDAPRPDLNQRRPG